MEDPDPEHAPRYWFAANRAGDRAIRPLTWEGWAVYAAGLAAVSAVCLFLDLPLHPIRGILLIMLVLLPFGVICYWKMEPLLKSQQRR
jgi:hypothetical protein